MSEVTPEDQNRFLSADVAEFMAVYDSLPSKGWLTKKEAWLLWSTARETEGVILEVGCYYGRSTCLLASLGHPIWTVDPFVEFDTGDLSGQSIKSAFLENIRSRGFTNVILSSVRVEDWIPPQDVRFGFAYLDGDHTYTGTLAQIRAALTLAPMAVAAHDVNDSGEGIAVKRACLELIGPWDRRVERMAVWKNLGPVTRDK